MAGIGWCIKIVSDLFLEGSPFQEFTGSFAIGISLFAYAALLLQGWASGKKTVTHDSQRQA
jgi:hypothetical protein